MKPLRSCTKPLKVSLCVFLQIFLLNLMVGFTVSPALAQVEDLRLTCRFVEPDDPVTREGFIWQKDVINVEYEFTNISGEHLMIPDPTRYKFDVTFTTAKNDTLDYRSARVITYSGITQWDYALVGLYDGATMKFMTNIVGDTRESRDRSGTGLGVSEEIEYPFIKGEIYRVHSKFRSEMKGFVETYGDEYRIWNGEISCEDTLEFRYE
ncbi:MAG: hypothetical protein OXG98_01930 [Gemmatimonadetes bacterium]|nr:hypothetical protein [Gemmatimonadota bacterium]